MNLNQQWITGMLNDSQDQISGSSTSGLRKKYRLNLKNDMPPRDKMDDPNITMEKYIRLEEEKAQKREKVFNWKTAKYGKIWYDEDVYDIRSVETEFPTIVFNDNLSSNETLSCEPTVSSLNNNEIDFRISFDESNDEDYTIIFDKYSFYYKVISTNDLKTDSNNDNEKVNMPLFSSPEPSGLQYTDADIVDFETRLARIYKRKLHRVQVFDFEGLPDLISEGLRDRMLIEHQDAQGQSMFTKRAWGRLFEIRGLLVHELIPKFFSTFRFGEAVLDLHTVGALQFHLGGLRRRMRWREFILALGLHTAEEIQTAGFGLYRAESARKIPDMGDLRMEVDSINVPYPLAKYLRLFASRRKQGAMISEDQRGSPMLRPVPLRPAEDAPIADEGAPAIPAPVQAPQPPPPTARPARTMAQRLSRVDEDVHEIRKALGKQRETLDSMAHDFSRFSIWMVFGLSQMMSRTGVRYTSYADFQIPYESRMTVPAPPQPSRIRSSQAHDLYPLSFCFYHYIYYSCRDVSNFKQNSTCLGLRKKYRLNLKNDMSPRDNLNHNLTPHNDTIKYNEQAKSNKLPIRTKNLLMEKWTPMNREVRRFNSLVNETRVMNGENDDD
nr:hypothetical protein [Tanacetum cinerariifolium]